MPSHCPGSSLRFCFFCLEGAFFLEGGSSEDSPSDEADISTSASCASCDASSPTCPRTAP